MSIHYKLKNTITYDAVKLDSVYISAADLKQIIAQQKKFVHSDLQVMNEETKVVYADHENIPKNTNIIVLRVPFANSNKRARLASNNNHHGQDKHGSNNGYGNSNAHGNSSASGNGSGSGGSGGGSGGGIGGGGGREAMELVSTKDMSEEEKIKYIQSQSTKDFDPARYARGGGRGGGHRGGRGGHHRHVVGPNYTCRKCGIPGHSIHDCKMSSIMKVKRSTGIPRDYLIKADSKEKGAVLTPSGEYAVHYLDREAYNNPKVERAPFFEDGPQPSDTKTPTQDSTPSAAVAPLAIAASSEPPTNKAKRKHSDEHQSGNNNDY